MQPSAHPASRPDNRETIMDGNEIAQKLSTPVTNGQAFKVDALNHAASLQGALVQALQIEQRRAAALHGADSQHAQTVEAYAAAHQFSLSQIQAVSTRAQIRAPLPNPQQ